MQEHHFKNTDRIDFKAEKTIGLPALKFLSNTVFILHFSSDFKAVNIGRNFFYCH